MTGPERDEFDRMIAQEIAGTVPSQGVVEEVNPWREPIGRIAWGLALTGITLNFLYLDYLLPAVGVVLQYLGFRALRRNGVEFRLAWLLSIVRLIWVGAFLVLSVTPWLPIGDLDMALGLTGMILQIVQLLALRAGLRQVCRTAGIEPKSDPLKAAACWEGLILVLAISPLAHSWLTAIPMLIAFVCIVRALFRLGETMGEAGYCFTAAPVHLNTEVVRWGYLGGCLLLMLALSACVNHPRLDAAPMEEHGETAIRQQLSDLGLPDEVLADLTDEDVRALDGALHVQVEEHLLVFHTDEGHEDTAESCDCPALTAETVYTELPGYRMAVLNWFQWERGSAYWNDGFDLWWDSSPYTLIGGRLLYEKDGTTYTAPIPGLRGATETIQDIMWGETVMTHINGTVGYPFGASQQRGYVQYVIELGAERASGNTCMSYFHQRFPISIPYQSVRDRMLAGGAWSNRPPYRQHLTMYHTIFGRGGEASGVGL